MLSKLLTLFKKSETPPEPVPVPLQKRVVRLEIELEELRALVEATWARQRKVEGAVHGMRGASRRHPSHEGETLDEFRARMIVNGRAAPSSETQNGEQ